MTESEDDLYRFILQERIDDLIRKAKTFGMVVTIEEKPLEKLAMGNTQMVSTIRRARGEY